MEHPVTSLNPLKAFKACFGMCQQGSCPSPGRCVFFCAPVSMCTAGQLCISGGDLALAEQSSLYFYLYLTQVLQMDLAEEQQVLVCAV